MRLWITSAALIAALTVGAGPAAADEKRVLTDLRGYMQEFEQICKTSVNSAECEKRKDELRARFRTSLEKAEKTLTSRLTDWENAAQKCLRLDRGFCGEATEIKAELLNLSARSTSR